MIYRQFFFVLLFSFSGYSLTVYKDTLYSEQYFNSYSSLPRDTFTVNNSPDSIAIDSVKVENIRIPCNAYQLIVYLFNNLSPLTYYIEIDWNSVSGFRLPHNNTGKLPPHSTIRTNIRFDNCIFCPTRKTVAAAKIGDTMLLKMRFYSAGLVDSAYIISVQRVVYASIKPDYSRLPASTAPGNNSFYSLSGRRLKQEQTVKNRVYIDSRNKVKIVPED